MGSGYQPPKAAFSSFSAHFTSIFALLRREEANAFASAVAIRLNSNEKAVHCAPQMFHVDDRLRTELTYMEYQFRFSHLLRGSTITGLQLPTLICNDEERFVACRYLSLPLSLSDGSLCLY